MDLQKIQKSITELKGDGWLFCDFHNRDHIAYDVLKIDKGAMSTRRWFYLIPAKGNPIKLVHQIEEGRLDGLPGLKKTYSGWVEMHARLEEMLLGHRNIFMQYSPMNNLPVISLVDAGTAELVRSFGIEIISSKDLVQIFKSQLSEENIQAHIEAGKIVQKAKDDAFKLIESALKAGRKITEYEVQTFINNEFTKNNLTSDGSLPIVAVNDHAANPHFGPSPDNTYEIKKGDRILIDLWARLDTPAGIYYDITWCGYAGQEPPQKYVDLFRIIVEARKKAKNFIIEQFDANKAVYGWQVDKVCRDHIAEKGYADFFLHRTGHSIDTAVHGSGVNLDNLETKDDRQILYGTCFSIEPGIYKKEMGVRTEINVFIDHDGKVHSFGKEQEDLLLLDV